MFKDIRADYGSTCTILTEHLRAVDVNISERTATAMLYAIKSDTLFFNRQANRVDLEAFSYLYPLADAALIRKMEGAEITLERLEYVVRATQNGKLREQVFCAFLGESPREDFIPYVADFFLQLEDVKWTIVSGVVNDSLVLSVRNLGYSRNAGEFVRKCFGEIGSAGGHRAMAKAVVPMAAFRQRFGNLQATELNEKVLELALQFLHEHAAGGSPPRAGASGRRQLAPLTLRRRPAPLRWPPAPARRTAGARLRSRDPAARRRPATDPIARRRRRRDPAARRGCARAGSRTTPRTSRPPRASPSRTPAASRGGEEVADSGAGRRPARAERMRSAELRRGGHDDHLAGARSLDLLEHAVPAHPADRTGGAPRRASGSRPETASARAR